MEILITILFIYFVPSIIAIRRKHQDVVAIVMVNTLLGWTIIAWFKCLFWSGTAPSFKVKLER